MGEDLKSYSDKLGFIIKEQTNTKKRNFIKKNDKVNKKI